MEEPNGMNGCDHTEIKFVPTPELTHYGKHLCASCGKFIGWVPKPETIEKAKENAGKIAFLKTKPLGDWEKGFLLSLEKQGVRHFSPKQQLKLDEIHRRYA